MTPVEIGESEIIFKASCVEDLYFNGRQISIRPKDCFSAILLVIWERVHDLFFDCSSKQTLENKIIDCLCQEGLDRGKAAIKADKLGLTKHFQLKQEVESTKSDLFEATLKKAELAWLRKEVKSAGGATGGAYRVFDSNKEPIGVFKVSDDHLSVISRIKQCVKSFVGQRFYLNSSIMAESHSEATAHRLDQFLKKQLTAQSRVVDFNGTKGCFQSYVTGMAEEKEKTQWLKKQKYEESELKIFQEFAVFDYALGNLDRHNENWFIRLEGGILVDIKAIDNANAFPERMHESCISRPPINQYAWAQERIASFPVSQGVKQWILEEFSENKREALSQILGEFFTEDMKTLFFRRLDVLCELSKSENFKPKDLFLYRSESEVKKIIDRN